LEPLWEGEAERVRSVSFSHPSSALTAVQLGRDGGEDLGQGRGVAGGGVKTGGLEALGEGLGLQRVGEPFCGQGPIFEALRQIGFAAQAPGGGLAMELGGLDPAGLGPPVERLGLPEQTGDAERGFGLFSLIGAPRIQQGQQTSGLIVSQADSQAVGRAVAGDLGGETTGLFGSGRLAHSVEGRGESFRGGGLDHLYIVSHTKQSRRCDIAYGAI
jgi:hypothetical protein